MNYQKVMVVGNATEDAKEKQAKQGGTTYAPFSVAVNEGQERVVFFPIMVFGKMSAIVPQYVTKGREVLVEGRMAVANTGRFSVMADRVVFGASRAKTS